MNIMSGKLVEEIVRLLKTDFLKEVIRNHYVIKIAFIPANRIVERREDDVGLWHLSLIYPKVNYGKREANKNFMHCQYGRL